MLLQWYSKCKALVSLTCYVPNVLRYGLRTSVLAVHCSLQAHAGHVAARLEPDNIEALTMSSSQSFKEHHRSPGSQPTAQPPDGNSGSTKRGHSTHKQGSSNEGLLRILCLHGRGQDAEIFSQRLSTLRRKLAGIAVRLS